MTTLTLCVVLLAAGLHATWNALVKSGDVVTRMALVQAMASLCALPFMLALPLPDRASWPYLLGSIVVHQAYFTCLMLGYRAGDLSQVYPVARGSAPLLVAVGAFVFAGEVLSPPGLVAVLVISLAIMSLVVGSPASAGAPTVIALATGVTIAGYTLLDGLGGRVAGDVTGYVAWLFGLEGLPLATFLLVRRWRVLRSTLRRELPAGALGGVFSVLAYGAVIWAMSVTPMTYISALRETSVILAALIGTRLLRESMGARRITAATAVALGVILLQVSGSG